MNKIIIRVVTPFLLALAMISGNATANTVSYDLFMDANLITDINGIYQSQKLATVTLTDISGGVTFEVETVIDGSLIAQLGFNFLNNTVPTGFGITALPTGWGYDFEVDNKQGFNGFGKFDVDVNDGGSAGRVDPLTFTVTGGTIADYTAESLMGGNKEGIYFSVHVTNLNQAEWGSCSADDNGNTCTAVTGYTGNGPGFPPAAIPVPAAVWLFGSGLLGLVGIARRRKSS